jgi:GPH family glycoside/pentoside/hexuronide:cation symporter
MRNRPAVILLSTYLVGSLTGAIPGLMMPFFTKYVLAPENDQLWLMIYLATYFGSGLITLPLWLRATRRFGKYPIYIVTALMGVSASSSLFFMGEGDIWPTFAILIWAGAAFGVRLFLGPSIQGDVIDYDELYTGKRREAQYGALWAIMIKFAVIPSAAIPLAIMAQLGYAPNVAQSEQVRFAISAIFGLAPATFGLLSLVVFLAFPIREHVHNQILAGIEKHKRGEAAEDPLTGKLIPPPRERGVDEDTGWFLDHFSPRELSRWLRRGGSILERHALSWAVATLGLSILAFWLVSQGIGDLSRKPGLATTLEVVVGGFSFTACVYQLIRFRAARRMRLEPVPHDVVRAHLEVTRIFAQNAKT